jgi:hypothetical protein
LSLHRGAAANLFVIARLSVLTDHAPSVFFRNGDAFFDDAHQSPLWIKALGLLR